MPSTLRGGFGDLAVFGGFGVKNHPPKKFWNVFGVIVGLLLLTIVLDDFDAFWAL